MVKELRPAERHASLLVSVWGDPTLMLRGVLCWLRSRFVSGAVFACVSTCLLLHYCSVCQVRAADLIQITPKFLFASIPTPLNAAINVMPLQGAGDDTRGD